MTASNDAKTTEKSFGKLTLIIKIVFFGVFLSSLIGLFYFGSKDHSNPLRYNEPYYINEWDLTTPRGQKFTVGNSYWVDIRENGVFTMETTLPDRIPEDAYFCFIVGGDVSVFVNGKLRDDFIASRDVVIPGGCVKRFYMRVPLYPEDAGGQIMMARSLAGRGGYVFQNTIVADESAFFGFMTSRYGSSFVLEVVLLIFSMVVFVTSLIMMILYKRRIEMLYGALAVFVISGWLITNSFLFPFVFGHYHIDGVLNYMFCLMMPFPIVFYLDSLQHRRYHIIMRAILCVSAVELILWPTLHVTRILSFPSALFMIDLILGIKLVIVGGILIADLVRGKVKEYRYTAIGLVGFFISGLLEILVLNFFSKINGDIIMLTGLAFMLVLAVVQQVSDLRRMREEGQRAVDLSEAKTKFLASMSHEIRTPINAILGMNEMILRENKDAVIGEYASSVKSSGQMLLMLVNDVLDFSKIESGKMEIRNAEFRLSGALKNIMPMIKERADEKSLKVQTIILNEVPDGIISDEFRIRQILVNLMNNAIKYTDSGSVTLMIGGEYDADGSYRLKMSVKDTGRGISKEDQEHLFEAFTRADLKKNRNIEGTGLGLAIVKSIIDSMNGDISVESAYGEGSEFIVHLPVGVFDGAPLTEDYDKAMETNVSGIGESDYMAPDAAILAVDDNSSNLKIVKLFLKRVGIIPDLCDSGSKAVEMCRTKHYDLILLDHMMPDPDGIKTLGLIRSDNSSMNRKTPVIVLTANALAGSDKLYKDSGFSDYLTKPIDSSVLEQTIRKYLPDEKVLVTNDSSDVLTFEPVTFKSKVSSIEGLDYDTALKYSGDDEDLLKEMIVIVTSECDDKIKKIRECLVNNDLNGYSLELHSIKGLTASVGLMDLSERAKKHEMAAKEENLDFIKADVDEFIQTYHDLCKLLGQAAGVKKS